MRDKRTPKDVCGEATLKGETAVSINVNNAKKSTESFIKIYVFSKLDLLNINFLSESCGVIYTKTLLERKRTDKH